jgi:DNA-binding PadR family transcriptional regulator
MKTAVNHRGRGRCGGKGPRMFDAGALRYLVLKRISEQPRHGYEIIKAIEDQSGGAYCPSAGMIYPMLSMLDDLGFVSLSTEGSRKQYAITPRGEAFLEENRAFVDAIEARIGSSRVACINVARQAMDNLKETIFARVRGQNLTEEQLKKVEAILNSAVEEIRAL